MATPQCLDIKFQIHWAGSWHVGSGFGNPHVNRLVQRRPGGRPFVPGALIKGVLRQHCEQIAEALGLATVEAHAVGAGQQQRLVEHFTALDQSELIVDRLFGNRFQGGCLHVDDALPPETKSKTDMQPQTTITVRPRVAIDRVTQTARDQRLFTSEIVEGDGVFQGKLRARHPQGALTVFPDNFPMEYSLLVAALMSLEALGGEKSSGRGRCSIEIGTGDLKWNGAPIKLSDAVQNFRDWDDWPETVEMLRDEEQD